MAVIPCDSCSSCSCTSQSTALPFESTRSNFSGIPTWSICIPSPQLISQGAELDGYSDNSCIHTRFRISCPSRSIHSTWTRIATWCTYSVPSSKPWVCRSEGTANCRSCLRLSGKGSTIGDGVEEVESIGLRILEVGIVNKFLLLFLDGEQVVHGCAESLLGSVAIHF